MGSTCYAKYLVDLADDDAILIQRLTHLLNEAIRSGDDAAGVRRILHDVQSHPLRRPENVQEILNLLDWHFLQRHLPAGYDSVLMAVADYLLGHQRSFVIALRRRGYPGLDRSGAVVLLNQLATFIPEVATVRGLPSQPLVEPTVLPRRGRYRNDR